MTASGPQERMVLVVDDDRELRETIQSVLEESGFAVVTATNGEEALAYLRRAPHPRVILLDLSMPVMDGITFREEQQKDAALASIPVIVFSASTAVAEKVRHLAVDGVLRKPIRIDHLLGALRPFCSPT
ncbi:MAG: response regulator [Deltaproteobacteria bacterium]|nr:response regulator [Deltaproteobacteria bacterium]